MVELDTSLWYTSIYLKGIASWPLARDASKNRKMVDFAHSLLVIISMTGMFLQILFFALENAKDVMDVTEIISTQVLFARTVVNTIMFRVHKNRVGRLVKSVENSIRKGPEELQANLRHYASIGNMVYGIFTSGCFLLASYVVIVPLFRPGRTLPLDAWYPFDYENSTFFYSLAYLHQIILATFCCLVTGNEVMFGLLVFHCCARLKVLQKNLLSLNEDVKEHGGAPEVEARKRISRCVRIHNEVLADIEDINEYHTHSILIFLLFAAIAICCTGFQITTSERHGKPLLFFAALICYDFLQILFYYLPSDILHHEALAVGLAAYSSNWFLLPLKERKSIVLIIIRGMKGAKLNVGHSGLLLLENYASFLTTTASYFTSLQAVTGSS